MKGLAGRGAAAAVAALVLWGAGPGSAAGQEGNAPVPTDSARAAPAARAGAGEGSPAAAQAAAPDGRSYLGAYALVAYDPAARQLGVVAASSGFSAGSGVPFLETGVGGALVLGRRSAETGRAALAALRSGLPADSAVARSLGATDDSTGLQVAVLTTGCDTARYTHPDAFPWTGIRGGRVDAVCYLAAGSLLADSTVLERVAYGFRRGSDPLLERLLAAVEAGESALGEVAPSRSAALWVLAPDAAHGALGRAELRLHVDAVQRPDAALRHVVDGGRADHLARRASARVEAGAYREALELAERAVETDPASGLAWLVRGRALLSMGRDDDAETAFQRMLEVNPYLLHVLGDPGPPGVPPTEVVPRVRTGVIPYRPRLLRKLDVYRRAFFPDVEFPSADTARSVDGGEDGGAEQGGGGG